jgi:hypothetical protein
VHASPMGGSVSCPGCGGWTLHARRGQQCRAPRWHRHSGNSPLPTTAWPMLTEARPKRTSTASGCPGSRWPLPLRPGLVPHPVVCSAPVLLPGFSPHIRPPLPARHTLRLAASPTPARPSAASSSQTAAAARLGLAALLAWLKSRPVGKACRFPRPGQSTMLMRE